MESDLGGLKDIRDLEISSELTPMEKQTEFLKQIGSSKAHKVGDIIVECEYGNMSLDKMLADLVCG